LLTSALVNAKVAAHETATRIAEAALARGTAEFVNWAQLYVAKHGAATTWPTTRVVDQPVAACPKVVGPKSQPCDLWVTINFEVSGSSVSPAGGEDPAYNLQAVVNENRISATIESMITNNQGLVVAGASTRATVRVFESAPFAILTGFRSSKTIAGAVKAFEGDTAGYENPSRGNVRATPDPLDPSIDKDTLISVSMTCDNSILNNNQGLPMADNNSPGNDSLPWGNHGGAAFEAPCSPAFAFSKTPPIPTDAIYGNGNVYDIGRLQNSLWSAFHSIRDWAP